MKLSGASVLDRVRKGERLQALALGAAMEDIVEAVLETKRALRYGVTALDEAGLRRRAGIEPWTVGEVVGHALRADDEAHLIARSLALGRAPERELTYGEPGPPDATKDVLLTAISLAEARAAEALVLNAGGPAFAHRDLGPLNARGWILFIALHDALHLHQAAAVVRTPR